MIITFLLIALFTFDNIHARRVNVDINLDNLILAGKIITIDPGHGGIDPGAMWRDIGEKDINLEISLKLKQELQNNGAIVFLTRSQDEDFSSEWDPNRKRGDLWRRILKIQENNSDIYLSIHLNSYPGNTESGAEVLYHPIHDNNVILGEAMIESFRKDYRDTRNLLRTDLYLFRNIARVPGVLIECGFLSTSYDRELLQTEEFQLRLAKTITRGVINYFKKIAQEVEWNCNLDKNCWYYNIAKAYVDSLLGVVSLLVLFKFNRKSRIGLYLLLP